MTRTKAKKRIGGPGNLTPTDREIRFLRYVARHINKYGFQPSYREMMSEFGWSSLNAPRSLVKNLQRKMLVSKRYFARAIEFDWRSYL